VNEVRGIFDGARVGCLSESVVREEVGRKFGDECEARAYVLVI